MQSKKINYCIAAVDFFSLILSEENKGEICYRYIVYSIVATFLFRPAFVFASVSKLKGATERVLGNKVFLSILKNTYAGVSF